MVCAHADTVVPGKTPHLMEGVFTGLLDNFLGIASVYAAVGRNHSLTRLIKEGKVSVFHIEDEEFLLHSDQWAVLPDFTLVVDVSAGEKYRMVDAAIENLTVKSVAFGKELQEFLAWEGYTVPVTRFTGDPLDMDESWMWRDLHVPTCSLILPIDAPGHRWHTCATCPLDRFDTFVNVLIRTLCFCVEYYEEKKEVRIHQSNTSSKHSSQRTRGTSKKKSSVPVSKKTRSMERSSNH